MLRFSLASLLILTLLAAVGCAALTYATPIWAGGAISVTLAALVLAVLAAVYRRGRARAFWLGFALCGGVYLLVVSAPWFDGLEARLLTTRSVALLQGALHPDAQPVDGSNTTALAFAPAGNFLWTAQASGGPIRIWDVSNGTALSANAIVLKSDFLLIGHSLWALLLACLGGLVAGILDATRGKASSPRQPECT